MEQALLPRGRGTRTPTKDSSKSKGFGFKNKKPKQQKQKKFIPKVKAMMKATDFEEGCIVLGTVCSVEDEIVYVDLPGGIRGGLMLTEVNQYFMDRLGRALSERLTSELPALDDFFAVGEYIMAVVTSSGTHPVELSIRPELVNSSACQLQKNKNAENSDIALKNAVWKHQCKNWIHFDNNWHVIDAVQNIGNG